MQMNHKVKKIITSKFQIKFLIKPTVPAAIYITQIAKLAKKKEIKIKTQFINS